MIEARNERSKTTARRRQATPYDAVAEGHQDQCQFHWNRSFWQVVLGARSLGNVCSVRSCSTTLLNGLRVSPERNSPVLRNWRKLRNCLNLRMELFTPVLTVDRFKVEHHALCFPYCSVCWGIFSSAVIVSTAHCNAWKECLNSPHNTWNCFPG